MKNKILARVVLIMTVAVFVTVALTFLVFNVYTMNTAKDYLVNEAEYFISQTEQASDRQDLNDRLSARSAVDEFYKYIALDGDKSLLYDGAQRIVGEGGEERVVEGEPINIDKVKQRHLNKAAKSGEAFFVGRFYKSGATLNYAVKVENANFDGGYVYLISSVALMYSSVPYFLVLAFAVAIWAGVIFASYVALTFNMKFTTKPFEKIERMLVDINNGEYTSSQIPEKLNFPEYKAVLTKIDDLAGEISKNFVTLQYEQKKSQILLQSVDQGIVIVSKSGRIVLTNAAALEIFGKENDVVGADLGYLVEGEELLCALRQSFAEKRYYVGEVRIGEGIYRVETNFNTIEENAVITGEVMLVIFTNVTIEVNSAKIRSEFFANASHELKTPLTAISGYSELMTMDGVSKPQLQKCIKEINGNALRMRLLIDDMLKLSKLDADMDSEEVTKFDLTVVCEEVVEEFRGVAESKRVQIFLEGKGEFIGRKKMIKMLVSNLVNNAVKYNRQDGHVWVSVKQSEREVVIKVKDDGIGIAKEHQSRLFERFYKVDASRTYTNESSTGLGLAIVKRITVIHGGKVSLHSAKGKGSEFIVAFPI